MRLNTQQPLFAWEALDDCPSLQTVQAFLAAVPDGTLLASLHAWRGKGRDDYPISVLWGTLLLTIVLRHTSIEACLAELRRNAGLRRLLGIQSEAGVPKAWNMSRFLDVLGRPAHLALLRQTFDQMIQRLGAVVPDLGRHTAGDASGLSARAGRPAAGCKLPVPTGGHKEYTDESGRVVRVVQWFGYKFHLLVDVKHEVVLGWHITAANVGDNQALPQVLAQAQANLPPGRIQTLAYDKACDDEDTHRLLHQEHIRPLIENRALWKEEFERPLPGKLKADNLVYDEAGTVYCYDLAGPVPVRHKMSYIGHEAARGTLKYRCPACHEGWSCPSAPRCNAGRPNRGRGGVAHPAPRVQSWLAPLKTYALHHHRSVLRWAAFMPTLRHSEDHRGAAVWRCRKPPATLLSIQQRAAPARRMKGRSRPPPRAVPAGRNVGRDAQRATFRALRPKVAWSLWRPEL
jgi:hypothetical protein